MTIIKAPYNFVPIAKEVVKPYWTEYISHDIPFNKQKSGEIEVTIHAKSPIFVKDGLGTDEEKKYKNDDGSQKKAYPFNQFDNKYFIPGSSIKGMIRSVLEVMSFGRMENKVNDTRYSVRDFQNNDIYPKSKISNNVQCGWLKKINGEYHLQDCGKPIRISHKAIDDKFENVSMATFFSNKNNLNTRTKSAKFKYDTFTDVVYEGRFKKFTNDSGRERCVFDDNGNVEGTLVFTGQPGHRYFNDRWDKWEGKFFEFVFPNKENDFQKIENEKIIENFFFAYYDHDKNNQKDDWKWRKPQLDCGDKIPVFFRSEGTGIKDMGLPMLYKIVYEKSVKESIKNYQKDTNYDLSEAIFGYIDEDKGTALKGRVHIGHAFAKNAQRIDPKKEVLSSPKASYYPNYIRQDIKNGKVSRYKTFMDKHAVIAGWKRYPIHKEDVKSNVASPLKRRHHNHRGKNKISDKIQTKFIPLDSGAKFSFTIRYHNLKDIELGALLSALTFHNTGDTFHSLGMAKPLGYGKVKLEVSGVDDVDKYLCAFESYMNIELEKSKTIWAKSEQIKELIAMVSEQENIGKSALEYMQLTDFPNAKKIDRRDRNSVLEALDKYSNLVNSKKTVTSLCTLEDVETMRTVLKNEEQTLRLLKPIEKVIEDNIAQNKRGLTRLFEEKKQKLIADLITKRKKIKKEEEKKRADNKAVKDKAEKLEKQKDAKDNGIKLRLNIVQTDDRDVFSTFRGIVNTFASDFYAKEIEELEKDFSNGFLPETAHAEMTNKLKEIFGHLNKGNKRRWLKLKKSYPFKTVTKWVGTEKATTIFDEFRK